MDRFFGAGGRRSGRDLLGVLHLSVPHLGGISFRSDRSVNGDPAGIDSGGVGNGQRSWTLRTGTAERAIVVAADLYSRGGDQGVAVGCHLIGTSAKRTAHGRVARRGTGIGGSKDGS